MLSLHKQAHESRGTTLFQLTSQKQHNVAYFPTKWHLDPSSRLATPHMGKNWGRLCPLGRGSWIPI